MARHVSLHDLISDEQEQNLRKLAAYLLTLPADYPDFEMSKFSQDGKGNSGDEAHAACGTAACAVGHGPNAGIEPNAGETWLDYSRRTFINDLASDFYSQGEWEWCFDGDWSEVDNTVHGAAKRILYLLANGMPGGFEKADRDDDYSHFVSLYTDMVLA